MKTKFIPLLGVLVLTSCGTKVSKLGAFNMDHSANWQDNYYTYFDTSLLSLTNKVVALDKDINKVFTSYGDENFLLLEPLASGEEALSYYDDFSDDAGYGQVMKLSRHNNYIREGVASKLFDGQLFCHGYYEAARVQINENGFSSSFGKKLTSADYLYLNFKSALDFKSNKVEPHLGDITINISFYNSDSSTTYSYSLKDVPTNQGETYIFYGFSLEGLDLNNPSSFSISYKLDSDSYIKEKGIDISHALLLYEFGFKNPTFQ